MKSLVILFLFIGLFMIVQGINEQKITDLKKQTRVEYKFIPRTLYDEQLADPTVAQNFAHMFETSSSWEKRKINDKHTI